MRRIVALTAATLVVLAVHAVVPGSAAAIGTGGCSLVAAPGYPPSGPGADTLTVEVDQEVTVWGTFPPNTSVTLQFFLDGEPWGDPTPPMSDADGEVLFRWTFMESQRGVWSFTAFLPDTDCSGSVSITVVADADAPLLPNTAAPGGGAQDVGPILIGIVLAAAAWRHHARRDEEGLPSGR